MASQPKGWPKPLIQVTANKSPTIKRPRPKGFDRLFYGTTVSSSRSTYSRGYAGQYYPPPPGDADVYRYPALTNVRTPTYAAPDPQWVSALLGQIKGQKVNLAQMLVEYRQTADMFSEYGRRVVRATSALVRKNPYGVLTALLGSDTSKYPRGWKEVLKVPTSELAKAQLTYSFGIKPLISDLQGSLEELVGAYQTKPLISRFVVTRGAMVQLQETEIADFYWDYGRSKSAQNSVEDSVRKRVVAYVEWDRSALTSDAARLGFNNLPYLLWEATPWSWLFDYFVNVGEYLENLDALHEVKRLAIHTSTTRVINTASVFVGATQWDVDATSKRTYRESNRAFGTELPPVTFQWRPHLTGSRLLNILSVTRAKVPNSFFNVRV